MDLERLKIEMPRMAEGLGKMMVDEGLGMMQSTGLTFDQATPSVTIRFEDKLTGKTLAVSLSVGYPDDEDGEEADACPHCLEPLAADYACPRCGGES